MAGAQPPPKPAAPVDANTEAARRHFQNGIKLYEDENYKGALAEFEAAYALKPGASSLKNIALSQKALYRYAEAAETLQKVLSKHAAELTPQEKAAVEQAVSELAGLVGSIVIRVVPAHAKVSVGGRAVDATQMAAGINLNVGEHTLVAEAPGYARVQRTVRVAGGQKQVPVDLQLQAVSGFLTIVAQHADDAIAVDSVARAFQKWNGPVTPGKHVVQVYRKGFTTFEQMVEVEVGRTAEISAPALEPAEPDEVPDPVTGQPPKSRQLRGWYGLVALSALGMRDAPDGLDVDAQDVSGGSFGVRAGYRLWTPIAVEMLLEGSSHQVDDACIGDQTQKCPGPTAITQSYTLESVRLGPNLRIMSGGETVRFTSTLGAGAVRHVIEVEEAKNAPDPDAFPHGKAKGWDPYFLLEVGAQFNWGHVLLEANVTAFIDGASNAKDGDYEPFKETGGLVMVGLGLRAGWSEWSPP